MKTIWVGLLLAGLLSTPARAETVTYLHTDLLGSVVLETDQNRNVVARYEYEPYGLPRQAIADAPGYTGHVHDAGSGLVYMQQRYYDPEVGRFLSVDPMPSDTATGWNFNRYNYAANNPYTFVDPDGRMVGKPWEEPWREPDPLKGPPDGPLGGPCKTGKACWGDDGGQSDRSQVAGFSEDRDPLLDEGAAKEGVGWIRRLKRLFGIDGTPGANAAARAMGVVVNTGISALDADVAKGVAAIGIRQNLALCEGAGNCVVPDDRVFIRDRLGETPPDYPAIGQRFIDRRWEYHSPFELLQRGRE